MTTTTEVEAPTVEIDGNVPTQGLHDRDISRAEAIRDFFFNTAIETDKIYSSPEAAATATLAATFKEAARQFDQAADATATARKRGWQSLSKEYRAVAGRVLLLAQDLESLADQRFEPALTATLAPNPGTMSDETARLVANSQPSSDDTMAYLRGDDNTQTARQAKLTPPANRDDQDDLFPPFADRTTPATSPLNQEAKAMTQTFPIADDPFSDPTPPTYKPTEAKLFPNVKSYTFAELMTPVMPPADLQHWSWSQLTTIEECGIKYRSNKIDQRPQRPMWSNVGGESFHKVGEIFDRAACVAGGADLVNMDLFGDLHEEWVKQFHKAIADTAQESGLPMGDEGQNWYAASSGKEGYTWWLVEGERMVRAYIEHRIKADTTTRNAGQYVPMPMLLPMPQGTKHGFSDRNSGPVIEYEYIRPLQTPVGQVFVKGVIDRAYMTPSTVNGELSIKIVDLKSSSRVDGDKTGQLGEYAQTIASIIAATATESDGITSVKIVGSFWDARRAIETTPVDLLTRHPMEEYQYRYGTAEYTRRTGIYRPTVSNFCKSCSANAWCPVGGSAKPGASS